MNRRSTSASDECRNRETSEPDNCDNELLLLLLLRLLLAMDSKSL